jgi:hypothetical protein
LATEKAFTGVKAAGTAMQWLFNAALWASPITWIVIGILALIAVIVLIATKTDWFQQAWKWAWTGIKAAAMAVWEWLSGTLWPWLQKLWGMIVSGVSNAASAWVSGWRSVWTFLVGWKDKIAAVFSAVGDFISSGFNKGKEAARSAINSIIGFVNGAIGGMNKLIGAANKIPGVSIPTIGNIPKLAGGGAVAPRRGGTPVIMGDGGEVEYGIPKSDMRAIIAEAVSAAGARRGDGSIVKLRLDFGAFRRAFIAEVSRRGGSAETVLSPGRG